MRIVHQRCYFRLTVKIGQTYTFYTETQYFFRTLYSLKKTIFVLNLNGVCYIPELFSTYIHDAWGNCRLKARHFCIFTFTWTHCERRGISALYIVSWMIQAPTACLCHDNNLQVPQDAVNKCYFPLLAQDYYFCRRFMKQVFSAKKMCARVCVSWLVAPRLITIITLSAPHQRVASGLRPAAPPASVVWLSEQQFDFWRPAVRFSCSRTWFCSREKKWTANCLNYIKRPKEAVGRLASMVWLEWPEKTGWGPRAQPATTSLASFCCCFQMETGGVEP